MPSALWKSGISPHPTLPEQGAVSDSSPNPDESEVDILPVAGSNPVENADNKVEKVAIENEVPQAEITQVTNTTKTTRKSKR